MEKSAPDGYDYIQEYFRLCKEIDSLYDVYAKAAGMSCSTLYVLNVIYMHQDNCTQKFIAEKTQMTKPTINVVITGFIEQGWVTLEEDPSDRRNKLITLTGAGRAYAETLIPGLMNAEKAAMESLGEQGREDFIRSTQQYYESFKQAIMSTIEEIAKGS